VFQLTCGCDGGASGGLTTPGWLVFGGESALATMGVKLVNASTVTSSSFAHSTLIDPFRFVDLSIILSSFCL
jgi:hypothetical protein